MKFKIALIAGCLLFWGSLSAMAQTEVQPTPTPNETTPMEQSVKNKDESWYFNVGLGWAASPSYGSETDAAIDKLKSEGTGFSRTPVGVDLGFYWPRENKRTILGVSLFGVNDKIEVSGYKIEITQSIIAASMLYYFGENVGDGFFGRADFGLARFSADAKSPSGSTLVSETSKWGSAAQLGVGYSLPVSPDTRLALGVYYSSVQVEDDGAHNFSVQLSCLL